MSGAGAMLNAAAIVVAGALIAAAIAVVGRWEIAGTGQVMYRVDRWTGDVRACAITYEDWRGLSAPTTFGNALNCEPRPIR